MSCLTFLETADIKHYMELNHGMKFSKNTYFLLLHSMCHILGTGHSVRYSLQRSLCMFRGVDRELIYETVIPTQAMANKSQHSSGGDSKATTDISINNTVSRPVGVILCYETHPCIAGL